MGEITPDTPIYKAVDRGYPFKHLIYIDWFVKAHFFLRPAYEAFSVRSLAAKCPPTMPENHEVTSLLGGWKGG